MVREDDGEVEVCLNKSTEIDISFELRIMSSPASAQGIRTMTVYVYVH